MSGPPPGGPGPGSRTDPRLEAAREWISLGARVVVADGKDPGAFLGLRWQHKATDNAGAVEEWIRKWPRANIGVVVGDKLLMIDVDRPERLAELERTLGQLPPTPRYFTGGEAGRERIVLHHPDRKLRKGVFGEGIEIRTGNLMSIVPPSINPATGDPYEFSAALDEVPVAYLPKGWIQYAQSKNGAGGDVEYELPEQIPHGQQWSYLVSVAGTLRKRGLSEAEILTTLRAVHERCEKPGPDENLRQLARSAIQWKPKSGTFSVAEPDDEPGEKFRLKQLSRTQVRPPRWAWEGWSLLGALTALVGAGGVGKSTLIAWMIAHWTRGAFPGHFHETPVNALIIGDEDDLDEIWTPKIIAMGGDESRVFGLEYAQGIPFGMVEDIKILERFVLERDIQIIYMDQVLDHLGGDLNANLPKDVRQGLGPIRSVARRHGRAVVFTAHPTKARGELSLRERAGGSHQFMDLPRVGAFLGYHPEIEGRRALARGKGNVGAVPDALTFEISGTFIQNPETEIAVETVEITNVTREPGLVAEVIEVNPPREKGRSKKDIALDALVDMGRDGAWHTRKEAEEMCQHLGIASRVFTDAFGELAKETRSRGRETEWKTRGATDATDHD